ncbi:MAG: NYN domain-containing protein [Thiomargarita sp.]|nr:NYN domain-containing protein [Thiomargarita sp.]
MRTTVYIDGFNLYYGCLKKTDYKWLDLYQLFKENLLDNTTTHLCIKYFTAKILPSDNPKSPFLQQKYHEALIKYSPDNSFEIIYGHFSKQKKYLRRIKPDEHYPEDSQDRYTVHVKTFEEKQSDVNIAVNMINDAYLNKFDQAVLCSNDTDLVSILQCLKKIIKIKK